MSTFSSVPNRRSFGNKSTKSTSSKRAITACFLKPTISSSLKRRQLLGLNWDDEVISLTETIGKSSWVSKKSPATNKLPIKPLVKSPIKAVSRFRDSFIPKKTSPAIKPKPASPAIKVKPASPIIKVKQVSPVIKAKSVSTFKNKFPKQSKENSLKKEAVKPQPQIDSNVASKVSSKKLEFNEKEAENKVDWKFDIPLNLTKKRDIKAADKIEQLSNQESNKEFADITNQNLDVLSSTTPMRWITGKSSVVKSNISLLQSVSGSGKSTPNITPYKMMRKNKEGGKDGTTNISNLEIKIKELEEQIMQSKNKWIDDEEDEIDNEFLDGIEHIRSERLKTIREETKEIIVEDSPEKSLKSLSSAKEKSQSIPSPESCESEKEIPENLDIKELEDMIGQVYCNLQNKAGVQKQSEEMVPYPDSISDSSKSSQIQVEQEEAKSFAQLRDAHKAKKSSQKRALRPTKRRKSSRHKRKYDHIELFHDTNWWNDEWFKDNEVWTRARMRKNRVYQKRS